MLDEIEWNAQDEDSKVQYLQDQLSILQASAEQDATQALEDSSVDV